MKRIAVWLLASLALCAAQGQAQSAVDGGPPSGSRDFQVWAGGGHSALGSVRNTAAWDAGARYGWVLTDLRGPGFLRGRFEYALDAVPVFALSGLGRTVYGISFDPYVLRWNFKQRRRLMPYTEISGGFVFTNHDYPPGENHVNFTPSAGIGVSVPHVRYRWSAELHYLHVSDAGLTTFNPGLNTLQLRIGFGLYTRPK